MTYSIRFAVLFVCALLSACVQETGEAPANVEAVTVTVENTAPAATVTVSIDNRGNSASGEVKWWDALPRADWAQYKQIETRDPWFEVYEITEGIYAIYEPGQFEEVISWLITGKTRALLFDTGLGMGDMRSVVKQLTKLPLQVLNSHGHYDHIGGNYQFETIMARKLPFTLQRSKGQSHEQVAEFATGDWIWKELPAGFDPSSYKIKPYEMSSWIEENQFIDLGGVSLEIIYAPGHAPDGIVLVDYQRRLMFTGDTFYPAPLYAHMDGSNFLDYAQTARKLAAMADSVDLLLPSHNVPAVSSAYLGKLAAAFDAIIGETASYNISEDGREYAFDGFSILTHNPPVTESDTIVEAL